ncbi:MULTISPECIES: site-specific integrase [Bacteroides]|jgi:integrase|uniref:site-specific integrase n=1 Tax=Bacteroides TaxID=816 RepID=UPI00189D8B3D|nr:site-specific integrase [Bacteroides nordii]MBD9110788.1 site-specific integrase [Bacteroides nordii]MCE8465126.1 site-specific integrase [Bacteroides nordii]MCQ4916640.1 site-specific integrase [Bacteroides nordii]UYU50834.1 site-specific integrase [Bacteroides nordii]
MASVKIKFRTSTVEGGQGTIYYQVIHNRVARQIKTEYRIYESEWNSSLSEIILSRFDEERRAYLSAIRDNIQSDIRKFQRIITSLEQQGIAYDSNNVVSDFVSLNPLNTLFGFMEEVIVNLRKLGKIRISETYTATLNSFCRFREEKDVALDKVDSDIMIAYEAYLKTSGVSLNSSSFYMRNLRAVYNRAVEKELTPQRFPFKHVYTGIGKTVKRAVPIKVIKQIKEMDLSYSSSLDFARDMFLFSFYTRGMSLVDMAYLRKKDLANGILSYRRRKTGQQLFIKWEKPMQEIADKYDTKNSIYLLPIIKHSSIEERTQYIYAGHNINRNLKIIGRKLGLSIPLTMYVARHAWASIAKSKNVPLSVISEGMGHDSEATTRIYLASLDNMAIDKANSLILKSL